MARSAFPDGFLPTLQSHERPTQWSEGINKVVQLVVWFEATLAVSLAY